MASIDVVAAVLAVAVLVGAALIRAVNDRWAREPVPIGMLLGSLLVVLLIAAADRILHLHVMQPIRTRLVEADLAGGGFFSNRALSPWLTALCFV